MNLKTFAVSFGAMGALAGASPPARADTCSGGPYMVFFAPGRATLSPQAAAILDYAAKAYADCKGAAIYIAGHTDRSGSDQANVALSLRAATSVRDYFIARGLPDGMMKLRGFGEARPLVETADGVAEPQNRRVEIIFAAPGADW